MRGRCRLDRWRNREAWSQFYRPREPPPMHLLPLPAFDDNYIWTWRDDTGRALVVDPGQAGPVLAAADDGLQPLGILLTPHHGAHFRGLISVSLRVGSVCVISFRSRCAPFS